jgi:hypothetical protein
LDRFWQESEPSQATGMALARCILGKFLGVVCHCFPLRKKMKLRKNTSTQVNKKDKTNKKNFKTAVFLDVQTED